MLMVDAYLSTLSFLNDFSALQINIIPLPVTMDRKIKKKNTGQIKFLMVTIK